MIFNEEMINKLNINKSDLLTIDMLMDISGHKDDEQLMTLLIMLFTSKNYGSSCLILNSDFFAENIKNLNLQFDTVSFVSRINDSLYANIITKNKEDYKPVYYQKNNDSHYFYFQKYFKNEQILKSLINKLVEKQNTLSIDDDAADKINKIISKNYKGIILNDYQKISVILSLLNDFLIISGGPGSGKTTTIIIIIIALLNDGFNYDDIALIAPTGKASNMLKESVINFNIQNNEKINTEKLMISTIHRLLKFNHAKKIFSYNKKNKLPYKVIIIDEVSMVDLILMTDLLEALEENIKIIFIGDKDQLPSVDVGSVLSDFLPFTMEIYFTDEYIYLFKNKFNINIPLKKGDHRFNNRIIVLEGNNRAENVQIKKISDLINKQDQTVINFFEKKKSQENDLFFDNKIIQIIPSLDKKREIQFMLKKWIEEYYFTMKIDNSRMQELIYNIKKTDFGNDDLKKILDSIFKFLSYSKILTILKEGIFGSVNINNIIYNFLSEKEKKTASQYPVSGIPVIITANDYVNQLFNGDIGIILEDRNNIKKIFFRSYSDYKSFNLEKISNYEICFSMTVHKSQGSGYQNIFLILPDNINNKLLTKEIIYTGITRAVKSITIYAEDEIIKKAINQKIHRQSGFFY